MSESRSSTDEQRMVPDAAVHPAVTPADLARALRARIRLLVLGPLAVGSIALGITYLLPPVYTASVSFLPPQQSQGGTAAALASLGSLAGLAGLGGGGRSQPELYASLLQRTTVADRMLDQFQLMQSYDADLRVDARKELAKNTRITVGRRDGLITVAVDDRDPKRAAAMANQYVEELRLVTSTLAVSEAQHRRVFFEEQLKATHQRLMKAQMALQASGFDEAALKAEPKSAAESYAKLLAEVAAQEVQLQALRGSLTDEAPEVRQRKAALAALRRQVERLEGANARQGSADYISRFREFKYAEALFEVYARQFELARVDEAREGALIQVVDKALPPERKSWPKRGQTAIVATLLAFFALFSFVVGREFLRRPAREDAASTGS